MIERPSEAGKKLNKLKKMLTFYISFIYWDNHFQSTFTPFSQKEINDKKRIFFSIFEANIKYSIDHRPPASIN